MKIRPTTVLLLLIVQVALCVFLSAREFRDFRSAARTRAQARSFYSYYSCSPHYQADVAAKKNAGPNEVVYTEGDFILQMQESWDRTETRSRSEALWLVTLTILTLAQLALFVRTSRRRTQTEKLGEAQPPAAGNRR